MNTSTQPPLPSAIPAPGSESADSTTPAAPPPWAHRPYADDPRIVIPIRCSLGSPLILPPGGTPAQREVAAASAEFCLGLLPESRARILAVNLDDLLPSDAWQAVEIIARHICAQGDWKSAAYLVSEQWKRLRDALADGEQPPGRRTTHSAVILQAAGDFALAAQICASVIDWGGCPLDHYQFACAISHLGKPVQALSVLLWKPVDRHYAGLALYDPDFDPMWDALANQRQSRRTRRLLAVLFGPDGTRRPPTPAMKQTIDVISFRALPRHFAPLFSFDPVWLLYELNTDALTRQPGLTAAYARHHADFIKRAQARIPQLFRHLRRQPRPTATNPRTHTHNQTYPQGSEGLYMPGLSSNSPWVIDGPDEG